MNQKTLLDNFTQTGTTNPGTVVNLPDTGATVHKAPKHDPLSGVVASLNANRDMNTTHDFDFFSLRDSQMYDMDAFNGIYRKILANRQQFNNFSGDPTVDFTNLTPAEIQYYSDFLGGFFKKVGHAVGSAAKAVGHGVGWVGKEVGHGAAWLGKEVAHGAVWTGHEIGNLASGAEHGVVHAAEAVGHGVGSAAKTVAHGVAWTAKEGVKLHKMAEKETGKIFKAVAPYWKDILAVATVAALAWSGVGIAVALAAGSSLLTGLNSIPSHQDEPELPPGFGSGGGDFGGGGAGFPEGMAPDDDNPDDDQQDENLQLSPEEQQQLAQQQADDQAAADAAAKKKKLVLYAGGIMIAIIAIYLIKRK